MGMMFTIVKCHNMYKQLEEGSNMNVDKEREKMYKQLEEGSIMNVDKEREKTLKYN